MKRSELKRTKPLVRTSSPREAKVRPKKCKACRGDFFPVSSWQTHCRAEACALAAGAAQTAKREKAEAREHRAKLADSKPLAHWLALTERVVNHLVLVRDADLPCISCDTRTTVAWQAGHYLSVGSHPELRFDLNNIHKQCHRCNVALSGNQAQYRMRLVPRIGQHAVELLEGPHPAAKFTREALAEIRREAAAETRSIERNRTAAPSPDSGAYLGAVTL